MFFQSHIPPVVKNLLIINVIIYLAQLSFDTIMISFGGLFPFGSPYFRFHELLTHMFLHGGWMHIIFNMIVLLSFGSVLERVWKPKRFFIFYFVCGIGAGIFHQIITFIQMQSLLDQSPLLVNEGWTSALRLEALQYLPQSAIPAIGASGAITGLIAGFAVLFPNSVILVWFFPAKAKYVAMGLLAYDIFSGIWNEDSGVANWAHVGGAITGFIITYIWKKRGYHLY